MPDGWCHDHRADLQHPRIGFLTYQSILKGEANLVVSIVTLLMLIFVVCNLVVDMLYAALDPRIRYA